MMTDSDPVAGVVARMRQRLDGLAAHRAAFLGTYLRTTEAVGAAVAAGSFEDPDWVARWDVAFAELYLTAHDAADPTRVPRPWRLAFDAPARLPALRHVLLGINAHVNYDLPQALLAVISVDDFRDPVLMAAGTATTSASTRCSRGGSQPKTTCSAPSRPSSTESSRR